MDWERHETAPAVPVRAKQGAEARNWSWVEASIWTDRMVSALDNGVKGGRWYSLMDKVYAPATLEAAWERVQANDGAAGVDGESIERFEAREDVYLAELSTALRTGEYRPRPIKRVEIPKGDGRTRPLGIPTVKDRVVQTAVKFALEPIFEATFRPTSCTAGSSKTSCAICSDGRRRRARRKVRSSARCWRTCTCTRSMS